MFRPRKFVSKCVLVSLSAVAAANSVGGCAQHVDDATVVETSEALSSSANKVLGFESTSNWSVTSGSGIVLKTSTTHTQGANSLSVNGTFTFDYSVFQGSTKSDTRSVWLNGTLIYQSTTTMDADGTTNRWQDMLDPVLPQHQIFSSSDGSTVFLEVDGKATRSIDVGADPSTLRFTDGTTLPNLTFDPNIRDVLASFEKDVGANGASCLGSGSDGLLAFAGDPHQGTGGVSGSQCTGCELACAGGELTCIAGAAIAASACTIGYGICLGVLGAGCILAYEGCQSLCHRSGTDCCPVGCGGESGLTTPIGARCNSGETCGRRANDDHVALCCSPGTTACGGELCCTAGEQCATRTSGPPQRGIILDAACCGPNNMNSRGECCNLGKCTTSADCGGSNTCSKRLLHHRLRPCRAVTGGPAPPVATVDSRPSEGQERWRTKAKSPQSS